MAAAEDLLVRDYILTWLEHLDGDVSFAPPVVAAMCRGPHHLSDLIAALEDSVAATVTKEEAHDAFFSVVGPTTDGAMLRIALSVDPCRGIVIHDFSEI